MSGPLHTLMPNLVLQIDDHVQSDLIAQYIPYRTIDGKNGSVYLKKNSRIGSHSTIMPGVTVGENAIVGAHSFVNRDVPANAVAVGVPARVMKKKVMSEE